MHRIEQENEERPAEQPAPDDAWRMGTARIGDRLGRRDGVPIAPQCAADMEPPKTESGHAQD